jgi:hypothetical protein
MTPRVAIARRRGCVHAVLGDDRRPGLARRRRGTRRALVAVACRRAADCGRAHVLAVFADSGPEGSQLFALGFAAQPSTEWLGRRLTYRVTGPFLTPEILRVDWRYSPADRDPA